MRSPSSLQKAKNTTLPLRTVLSSSLIPPRTLLHPHLTRRRVQLAGGESWPSSLLDVSVIRYARSPSVSHVTESEKPSSVTGMHRSTPTPLHRTVVCMAEAPPVPLHSPS